MLLIQDGFVVESNKKKKLFCNTIKPGRQVKELQVVSASVVL